MGVGYSIAYDHCCASDEITCDEIKESGRCEGVMFTEGTTELPAAVKVKSSETPRAARPSPSKVQDRSILTDLTEPKQRASSYTFDPRDSIDVEVHRILRGLTAEARSLMSLRRIAPGKYEIDGRPCTIYYERQSESLLVHEDDVIGVDSYDMSIHQYFQLAASVAIDSRRKRPRTLTFLHLDASNTDINDVADSERSTAMRFACVQAGVWEGDEPPPLIVAGSHVPAPRKEPAPLRLRPASLRSASEPPSIRLGRPVGYSSSDVTPIGLGHPVAYSSLNRSGSLVNVRRPM
jgi:hypothetical protein